MNTEVSIHGPSSHSNIDLNKNTSKIPINYTPDVSPGNSESMLHATMFNDSKSSYVDDSSRMYTDFSTSSVMNESGSVATSSGSLANSSSSIASSNKSKKKRWGILMGRSKSGEKVKSATLGREGKKVEKPESVNKQRWSTGLPRFNPLPPSISKETMVNNYLFIYCGLSGLHTGLILGRFTS